MLTIEVRLERWKEEFERLYILAPNDVLEALQECQLIDMAHKDIKEQLNRSFGPR